MISYCICFSFMTDVLATEVGVTFIMYTLCKTTHQATGVEHSLYCNFFNNFEKSLVVCCNNILKVYRLVPELPARPIVRPDTGEFMSQRI